MATMSEEDEAFLARWSKRKAQARARSDSGELPGETPQEPVGLQPAGAQDNEADEIAFEDLPPIDSIDASTDLTPWLRKKIPEAWKQAALSRVWATDPAISQFIGISENAWDWNVPDGVPGFGPLRATDDVAQLLAQAMGQMPRGVIASSEEGVAEMSDAPQPELSQLPEMPKEAADEALIDESLIPQPEATEIVSQSPTVEDHKIVRRRRGGGALPS
jgi:hypothetical protein